MATNDSFAEILNEYFPENFLREALSRENTLLSSIPRDGLWGTATLPIPIDYAIPIDYGDLEARAAAQEGLVQRLLGDQEGQASGAQNIGFREVQERTAAWASEWDVRSGRMAGLATQQQEINRVAAMMMIAQERVGLSEPRLYAPRSPLIGEYEEKLNQELLRKFS